MCTVTFIPAKHGCFITSSRDENAARERALPPALYEHNGTQLIFPKDAKAGGSWIALTQSGNAAVLLNGAFSKHTPRPPYRKSRGLVFLDIIAHPQPDIGFWGMNLDVIEPFTLVLFTAGLLFECRWNGEQKHFRQLDTAVTHIWSSATLYSAEIVNKRKQWFDQWLTATGSPTAAAIFNFHRFAGDGDEGNSILMNRDNQMLTVSITSIELNNETTRMRYFDTLKGEMKENIMPLSPVTV